MRILIVKPSSIGDVLHAFPAVALIRACCPQVQTIHWVVNDSLAGVVRLCPGVDRIIPFPRASVWKPAALRSFLKDLRQEDYDCAIDYQGLFRSAFISRASRSKEIVGFANAREGAPLFYHRALKLRELHAHAVDKNLELTRFALGLPASSEPSFQPFTISDEDRRQAESLLPTAPYTYAVCFSSRWKSKNWSMDFVAQVLEQAAAMQPGARFWLLGAPSDIPDGQRIAELAPHAHPLLLAGKTTLGSLAALLERSSAMLTVDSGPMHLAAAARIPCVALFGSTDPVLTGPYGAPGFHTIITTPCDQAPCMKRICPRGINCCDGCSPAEVAAALLQAAQRGNALRIHP